MHKNIDWSGLKKSRFIWFFGWGNNSDLFYKSLFFFLFFCEWNTLKSHTGCTLVTKPQTLTHTHSHIIYQETHTYRSSLTAKFGIHRLSLTVCVCVCLKDLCTCSGNTTETDMTDSAKDVCVSVQYVYCPVQDVECWVNVCVLSVTERTLCVHLGCCVSVFSTYMVCVLLCVRVCTYMNVCLHMCMY